MKCIYCGKENVKAFIHLQFYIDADDNGHITKKVLRKKSTELVSQSHDKTSWVCPDCNKAWGFVTRNR